MAERFTDALQALAVQVELPEAVVPPELETIPTVTGVPSELQTPVRVTAR
jgi:hypothetical protein